MFVYWLIFLYAGWQLCTLIIIGMHANQLRNPINRSLLFINNIDLLFYNIVSTQGHGINLTFLLNN